MRPFVVVLIAEPIESPLLRPAMGAPRPRRLPLQLPMHPLVPSVLLRMPHLDLLRPDPQLDPPHRQPAQPSRPDVGEGLAVVGTNDSGKAVLTKGGLENRPGQIACGPRQPLAPQDVPTEVVHQRQGMTILTIPHAELPLEVRRP